MKFNFIVYNHEDGSSQRIGATDNSGHAVQIQAACVAAIKRICGAPQNFGVPLANTGRSRPVVVIGVNPESTISMDVGDEFPSARALSEALGYNYSAAVTQALMQTKNKPPEVGAELRGVRVQYKDVWEKHKASEAAADVSVE